MSEYQRICLVHYHKIGLKGHNRASFEQRLLNNIAYILKDRPIESIRRISGRVCIHFSEGISFEDSCSIAEAIKGVPGVARISCGYVCDRTMEDIDDASVQAAHDVAPFNTFKVAARRNHTDFPVHSMQMNCIVGDVLSEAFPDATVRMKDPDAIVHVEVIEGAAYVYARTERGVGGLPVGTGGRVMCLLSSGIDSPVATWRLARRGAECIGVHFSGRPQTASTSEYLVDDIAHVLERTGCIARLYVVPFGYYQRKIAGAVPPQLRIIIYRRLMFRVAQRLARDEKSKALATGESLGQVASQTLDNIAATDDAVSMPVLRPLIGMDKLEIIDNAQQVGTFEISSQDAPDCCTLFMPRAPETHARIGRVHAAEASLPLDEWVEEIAAGAIVHDYRCASYMSRKHPHATSSNDSQ